MPKYVLNIKNILKELTESAGGTPEWSIIRQHLATEIMEEWGGSL